MADITLISGSTLGGAEYVAEHLAGGYPSTGAALPVSRKLPGRGLLLSRWGEHNARYRAGTFLWALFCAAAVAYWRRRVGAILATALGTCVVSVSYNAEARNLGNG